jgi:hypothetical protein
MGLWGRLEAMRAPIIGKAKKGTPINKSVGVNLSLMLLGTCGADRMRAYSAMMATNMATLSADNDHANQEMTRPLVLLTSDSCTLALSVTTPLYSSTVSQTLRTTLRAINFWTDFVHAWVM